MAGGGAGRTEDISIHAPRTGSDAQFAHGQTVKLHFNPRSPHGERLVADSDTKALVHISIHAPRTGSDGYCLAPDSINAQHFNPRSPHGERLAAPAACNPIGISIHAPRTGSDADGKQLTAVDSSFQSTLPARGATKSSRAQSGRMEISIHAPRTGSDSPEVAITRGWLMISIHAPRTGSDLLKARNSIVPFYFNPRSPHGERRDGRAAISIHAPRTGSDVRLLDFVIHVRQFQSTLPARGATFSGKVIYQHI